MSGEHKPRDEDLPNPNGTDSVTPEETARSSKAPPICIQCSAALSEHRGTGTERFSAFAMVMSLLSSLIRGTLLPAEVHIGLGLKSTRPREARLAAAASMGLIGSTKSTAASSSSHGWQERSVQPCCSLRPCVRGSGGPACPVSRSHSPCRRFIRHGESTVNAASRQYQADPQYNLLR